MTVQEDTENILDTKNYQHRGDATDEERTRAVRYRKVSEIVVLQPHNNESK